MTRAIVEDRSFAIDRGVARQGEEWSDLAKFEGHYYSDKAPGLSFLAVPVHAALLPFGSAGWSDQRVIYACRLVTITIPCLIFLLLRVRRARSPGEAGVWIALGVGSLLYTQALSFTAHLPAGILLLLVLELLGDAKKSKSSVRGVLVGALAAAAVALDYLAALPLAVLGLFALVRGAPARIWAARVAGFTVPIAGLLAYHWVCFGGPFELAYDHMVIPVHQANRTRGFFGATLPEPAKVLSLLSGGDRGLFLHAPLLLGSLVATAVAMRQRSSRAEASIVFSLFGLLLLFNAALADWEGGWGVGPRYLTLVVPVLAWALARWHADLPRALGVLAAVAAGWSALLHVGAVATFPLAPFRGPLRFPALELAAWLGERGMVAWNPGFLLGMRGLVTVVPLAVALLALAFVGLERRQVVGAFAGALLLVAVAAGLEATRGVEGERELASFAPRAGYVPAAGSSPRGR